MSEAFSHILQQRMDIETYVTRTHEVPYTYEASLGAARIVVLGTAHTTAANDPVFSLIDQLFTTHTFAAVLLEGVDSAFAAPESVELIRGFTRTEAITEGAETGYALWCAVTTGVPWRGAEPADAALFAELKALGFTEADIAAWLVLRLLPQYHRRSEVVSYEEYAAHYLTALQEASALSPQYALASAWAHAVQVLGHEPNHRNLERMYSYTDPRAVATRDRDYTIFNTLSATADELRDRAMISKTCQAAAEGSVLLVCGSAHAVMQEPAYRVWEAG